MNDSVLLSELHSPIFALVPAVPVYNCLSFDPCSSRLISPTEVIVRRSSTQAKPPKPRSNTTFLPTENTIGAGCSARIDLTRGIESGTMHAFALLLRRSTLLYVAQFDITDMCFGAVAYDDEVVSAAHVLINGTEFRIARLICAIQGRCVEVGSPVG